MESQATMKWYGSDHFLKLKTSKGKVTDLSIPVTIGKDWKALLEQVCDGNRK